MKAPFDFVIEPKGNRYNNTTKIDDKNLILNTEIFNHQFVNREAIVRSVPTAFKTEIKPGDTIVTHHNVFRRWHDVRGNERNSRSYFDENTYLVKEDQIFLYKRNGSWIATNGYCFVQPIKQRDKLKQEAEEHCLGIVKYTDGIYKENELVGFTPFSTYEFIVNNERLYRVMNKFITIKYEYQGNEEAYNPSWAQSS
jgi:hypothetical protein